MTEKSSKKRLAIFVISLLRSSQRRQNVSETMGRLDVPFEFVDAFDASDGFDESVELTIERKKEYCLSEYEYACALSHKKALQSFLEGKSEYALILEDDAILDDKLVELIDTQSFSDFRMLVLFHSYAFVYLKKSKALLSDVKAYPLALSCNGAVAYTVDRDAASALINAYTPVKSVADWPMEIWKLDAYVAWPFVVRHPIRDSAQTTILGSRASVVRRKDPFRFLKVAFLEKKYRKIGAKRIS